MEINVPVNPDHQKRVDTQQRYFDADSSALLKQLVHATPAQVHTWVTNNVTTIAQAQAAIEALALAVRYLYLKGQQS